MIDQCLAVGAKLALELPFPLGRLGEQAAVGDLADVTRVEIDGDRETVAQLIQLGGIMRSFLDDLGQRLLTGGDDPHSPLAQLLQVARQAVEVED